VAKVIATPPEGYSANGYFGMGGVLVCTGAVCTPQLDLVLISFDVEGFYFCYGATPSGCGSISPFIGLPGSFCASMFFEVCSPDGSALDNKLNLYYADAPNGVVVECTSVSDYTSCTVLENLYPQVPSGLFRDASGNLWASDSVVSCPSPGYVWKNGVIQYTVGDFLDGITLSTANLGHALHVYVADDAHCSGNAHIIDLTDGKSLPTPFVGTFYQSGLSTTLQFSGATLSYPFPGAVYQTQDTI